MSLEGTVRNGIRICHMRIHVEGAPLAGFEVYMKENGVDFGATKFYLGQELTIDPKTELATDSAANQLFTREYRQGFGGPAQQPQAAGSY